MHVDHQRGSCERTAPCIRPWWAAGRTHGQRMIVMRGKDCANWAQLRLRQRRPCPRSTCGLRRPSARGCIHTVHASVSTAKSAGRSRSGQCWFRRRDKPQAACRQASCVNSRQRDHSASRGARQRTCKLERSRVMRRTPAYNTSRWLHRRARLRSKVHDQRVGHWRVTRCVASSADLSTKAAPTVKPGPNR